MSYKTEWQRNRRAERKAHGLCVDCGSPVSPVLTRCAKCHYARQIRDKRYRIRNAERLAEKNRMLRQRYHDEGKCGRCGNPLIEDEVGYCMACKAGRMEPVRIGGVA